jgi:D-arginine dehydrogenase
LKSFDILVVGGGVAGLSAASALSRHARVLVIEGEQALGYHSSGRSATMLHYALGDRLVRALTLASRHFFEDPPAGFTEASLGRRTPVLIHAREHELPLLDSLQAAIAPFAELDRIGPDEIVSLCPIMRVGEGGAAFGLVDRHGIRLDPDGLLQGFARALRNDGGALVTGARVVAIEHRGGSWEVAASNGERFSASLIINAAGAWADAVAAMAGVAKIGVRPMRRTIITFDGPEGVDSSAWPFTKTVGEELYFAPESGRLFASPMDEVPTDPCDAQADEYEVALAAWRMEERTTLEIKRIHSRWAGLRTFAPDRHPVVGFDSNAPGFFWLAGQGGFGLQTSPAIAGIVESMLVGTPWSVPDVAAEELSPSRFKPQPAEVDPSLSDELE